MQKVKRFQRRYWLHGTKFGQCSRDSQDGGDASSSSVEATGGRAKGFDEGIQNKKDESSLSNSKTSARRDLLDDTNRG